MARQVNGVDSTLRSDSERTQSLSVSISELQLDFAAIQQLLNQTKLIVDRLTADHEGQHADIADAIWETSALLKSIEAKLAGIGSKATDEG